VLRALQHDHGWDARNAEVIVGTSAGSIVGALLRAGVSPEDLAAWATEATSTQQGRRFRALMRYSDGLAPVARVPSPTLPGWHSLRTLAHPSQVPAALISMLTHGLVDHAPRLAIVDRLLDQWPTKPLWISAVRVGDGRLTWFGRTNRSGVAGDVSIATGVTHDVDLMIVLSPMGHAWNVGSKSPLRRLAHRRLRREVDALSRSGVDVQVIGPDATTIASMGWNMLDRNNSASVMRHAFVGTSLQLHSDVTTKSWCRAHDRSANGYGSRP